VASWLSRSLICSVYALSPAWQCCEQNFSKISSKVIFYGKLDGELAFEKSDLQCLRALCRLAVLRAKLLKNSCIVIFYGKLGGELAFEKFYLQCLLSAATAPG